MSMDTEASDRAFRGVAALLFAASAVTTVGWCRTMATMDSMPMPGGWAMSMTWMRMPGESWPAAAASFLGMWLVMMLAMMLPAFVPMLGRYRRMLPVMGHSRRAWLTSVVGVGYFLVWSTWGLAAYPIGIALADAEMRLPSLASVAPLAAGLVALLAGALQFTTWKARQLACCRATPLSRGIPLANVGVAFRYGLHLGLRCSQCCANLTALLLVAGVMDLRVMAAVTVVIAAERLAPAGERVARITGVPVIVAGLFALARSLLAAG